MSKNEIQNLNKKGGLTSITSFLVVVFSIAVISLVSLVIFSNIYTKLADSPVGDYAPANASLNAIGDVIETRSDWVYLMSFIGLVLGVLVAGYFASGHPLFAIIYVLGLVVLAVVSGMIQYSWEAISTTTTFLPYMSFLPITSFIMGNLVLITIIVGFLGGIVLYASWPQYGGV